MKRNLVSRDYKTMAASGQAFANFINVGARIPTKFPDWVTLEVATGGFATGKALSQLAPDEESSLAVLQDQALLERMLFHVAEKRYRVERPEDTVLPILVGLINDGMTAAANKIIAQVAPYLTTLRFYPVLTEEVQPDVVLDINDPFSFDDMMASSPGSRFREQLQPDGTSAERRHAVAVRNLMKWALFDLTKAIHAVSAPVLSAAAAEAANDRESAGSASSTAALREALEPLAEEIRRFFKAIGITYGFYGFPASLQVNHCEDMRLACLAAQLLNVAVRSCVEPAPKPKGKQSCDNYRRNSTDAPKHETSEARHNHVPLPERFQSSLLRVCGRHGWRCGSDEGVMQTPTRLPHRGYDDATRVKETTEAARMLAYEVVRQGKPNTPLDVDAVLAELGLTESKGEGFVSREFVRDHVMARIREALELLQNPAVLLEAKTRRRVSSRRVRIILHTLPLTLAEHVTVAKTITSAETLSLALGVQVRKGVARRTCQEIPPYYAELFARTNDAFAKRRSLLLLNYERQTQLMDLPWISDMLKALSGTEGQTAAPKAGELKALQESVVPVVVALLSFFGGSLIPNTFVSALKKPYQEILKLVDERQADLALECLRCELTEPVPGGGLMAELAQDIFMGDFVPSFYACAENAVSMLKNSVYDRFFGMEEILTELNMFSGSRPRAQKMFKSEPGASIKPNRFVESGKRIEAMQVVTTHNVLQLYEICARSVLRPVQTYRQLDQRARIFHVKHCKKTTPQESAQKAEADNTFDPDAVSDPYILLARASYRTAVEQVAAELHLFSADHRMYIRMLARRRLATAVRQMLLFLSLRYKAGEAEHASAHMTAELVADLSALKACIVSHPSQSANERDNKAATIAQGLVEQLENVVLRGQVDHRGFFGWV